MIIGLTGRNASGKGTVADWFVAQQFGYVSLSDAIRQALREQGLEPTRDNMIAAGRNLRASGGAGVLAEKTLPLIALGADFVVDSIRNPAEVQVLRRRSDFVLLDIQADEAARYARLSARARAGDALDFKEFQRQERAELQSGDAAAQQLVSTAALADVTVNNDGDLAALIEKLQKLLSSLRERFSLQAPTDLPAANFGASSADT